MVHLLISGIIDLKNVKSCDVEKTLDSFSVALRWKNLTQRAGAIGSQRNCPERGPVTSSVRAQDEPPHGRNQAPMGKPYCSRGIFHYYCTYHNSHDIEK